MKTYIMCFLLHVNCWDSALWLCAVAGHCCVNILQTMYPLCYCWVISYSQFEAVTNSAAMHILVCVFWRHRLCWDKPCNSWPTWYANFQLRQNQTSFHNDGTVYTPRGVGFSCLHGLLHLASGILCNWVILLGEAAIKLWFIQWALNFGKRCEVQYYSSRWGLPLVFICSCI